MVTSILHSSVAKLFFILLFLLVFNEPVLIAENTKGVSISEESQDCLDCHESDTPGIVDDWLSSRHSKISPETALGKQPLERRVSAAEVPEELKGNAIGCYECHGLNPQKHRDNFIHNGYRINIVVSPDDCATCHPDERKQYGESKKAHALEIMEKNPLYMTLLESIDGVQEFENSSLQVHPASEITKGKTCFACHGTRVEVKGNKTIKTAFGETVVPNLTNWPNQGVGRINPDGSKGACTACHPRHGFSIEVARKPYTCSQCHLAPDAPAWEVYSESKHGNLFFSTQNRWNWNEVPWTMGKDFKTPTCAVCHNALLVNGDREVVAERTHNFGSRLWARLFGLIYSHPQPKDGKTYQIKNGDGLPLPTSFSGGMASSYLIGKEEQQKRQGEMTTLCRNCHSTDWIEGHFQQMEVTNRETDRMVQSATRLMQEAWQKKMTDPSNPFDEPMEKKWVLQWLFYANSVRYGAAMGGPDYSTFKYGWWDLSKNLREMEKTLKGKAP